RRVVNQIRCAPASMPCARATAAAKAAVEVVVAGVALARAARAARPILCGRTSAGFVNTPRAASRHPPGRGAMPWTGGAGSSASLDGDTSLRTRMGRHPLSPWSGLRLSRTGLDLPHERGHQRFAPYLPAAMAMHLW